MVIFSVGGKARRKPCFFYNSGSEKMCILRADDNLANLESFFAPGALYKGGHTANGRSCNWCLITNLPYTAHTLWSNSALTSDYL